MLVYVPSVLRCVFFFQSLRAVGTIFNSSHENDEMHPALGTQAAALWPIPWKPSELSGWW